MNSSVGREALSCPVRTTTSVSKKVGILVSSHITSLGIQNVVEALCDAQIAFNVETVEQFQNTEIDERLDLLIIEYTMLHQLNDGHHQLRHRTRAMLVVGANYDEWSCELEFSLQAGAHGYCRSDVDAIQLEAAMRSLFANGSWFDGNALEFLREISIKHKCSTNALPPLTQREFDVLQRIVRGMSNPQIGAELFISVATVKAHVREIFTKLNVHNRAEAASEAVLRGLVKR